MEHNTGISQKDSSKFYIMMSMISISLRSRLLVEAVISTVHVDLPSESNKQHKKMITASSQTNKRHHSVTPEDLSSKWNMD